MELKPILRLLKVDKLALLFLRRPINTEVSLLTVVLELRLVLMSVNVAVLWDKRVDALKMLWGLFGIAVGLLWEADDSFVDVRLAFFYEL